MRRALLAQFDQYVKLNKKIPPEILTSLAGIDDAGRLADTIAAHLPLKLEQKQKCWRCSRSASASSTCSAARSRDRHPAGGKAHPRPRQAPDGEEPARVLPERAGQGDPEGAGRGRRGRRPGRDGKEDQGRAHAQGSRGQGRGRAEEAAPDVADVGRGDGGAQLHRHAGRAAVEEEEQDQQGPRQRGEGPRRGPLRPGEGQGAHRRVPRGAAARRQAEGADPVPGRAARRRQDLARPVDRARDQPQVRPHVAGRRARRGRRSAATAAPTSARCPARSCRT